MPNQNMVAFFLMTIGFTPTAVFNISVARALVEVDLYTQYSLPWGGQGLHMASDAFPPQGVVQLRTNVTFLGDGVSGKPVSYVIESPNGETYYTTSLTQEEGIAVFEFSLPGLVDYFGQWKAKATVDFAGKLVCDTISFLMGWLVEVAEVEASPLVHKGETMDVNVTLTRICVQDPRDIMNMFLKDLGGSLMADNNLLLCITVTDEVKQPVAAMELDVLMISELDICDLDDFVANIGEHVHACMHVVLNEIPVSPYFFSGKATIHASILTNVLGTAYCPEGSGYTWLTSETGLDRNGEVRVEDVNRMKQAFGAEYDSTYGLYWHDPQCTFCPHDPTLDLNGDSIINIFDIVLLP